MIPTEELEKWVALKHKSQVINCTGKPYFTHLKTVAEMAKPFTSWGYEIGLCHDLLEDTGVVRNELFEALFNFGYANTQAHFITDCVVELTDVFTAAAYPGLSKADRKVRESARLITISPDAQTVKYCDLIDNISWVLQYDQKNAERYLRKKAVIISWYDTRCSYPSPTSFGHDI